MLPVAFAEMNTGMSQPSADLFAFLANARETRSMSELDNAFAKLIQDWGFDRWTTMPIASPSLGPVRPFKIVFGRGSDRWRKHYIEKNYYLHDAAIRTLQQSNEAIWWTSFGRTARLSSQERRLFDEARAFGVVEGLSAPIRLADQSVWVCALTGRHAKPHREVTDAARFAAERYLLTALRFRAPEERGRGGALVTPGQMEIVRLLVRGLNLKQSAQALGLSPSTVYNQMADARRRMAVKTVPELLRRMSAAGKL